MGTIADKRPLISTIISTYNYGQFIEEAIDSILCQTFPQKDMEIIVVDDGSTDDTPQRVKKYKDRIKYIRKENGGHASGLNVGFQNAKGEIIFFMDADDYWRKDKIEKIQRYYEQYNCKALFHNANIVGDVIEKPQPHFKDCYLKYINRISNSVYSLSLKSIKDSPAFLGTLLSVQSYRRSICEKIFPIPQMYRRHPDIYLFIYALLQCDIYYEHNPLSYYRQHLGSHMASISKGIGELQFSINLHNLFLSDLRKYGKKTENLISMFVNKSYYDRFLLEKLKGRKMNAFMYLAKYKPEGPMLLSFLRKCNLALSVLISERWYKLSRSLYSNSGLRNLRKNILIDRFNQ